MEKEHITIPGQVTIFDIFEYFEKQMKQTEKKAAKMAAEKTKNVTAVNTIKRKASSKDKYKVVTKIYDSGLVVISSPVIYTETCDECGWTSKSYKGYDEYIDIFESELGAWRYIRDERSMAIGARAGFELQGAMAIPECITNPTKNKPRKKKTA